MLHLFQHHPATLQSSCTRLQPPATLPLHDTALQAKKDVPVALWKKKNAAARVRREYKTADEVLAAAGDAPPVRPAQAILDMRGPQARVVTNMEHLNVQDVRT